jgi:predicted O-methyltransferase YrrM
VNPYLSDRETDILIDLINGVSPRAMMEFGCNYGRTAKMILEWVPSLERYIGIDVPRDYVPVLACQRSEVPMMPGFFARDDARFELMVLPGGTRDLATGEMVDAIFIDGDHSAEGVLHDSLLARRMVRAGGLIVWHDYGNEAVDVTEVLRQLAKDGWPLSEVCETWLAFMHVPSEVTSKFEKRE